MNKQADQQKLNTRKNSFSGIVYIKPYVNGVKVLVSLRKHTKNALSAYIAYRTFQKIFFQTKTLSGHFSAFFSFFLKLFFKISYVNTLPGKWV